MGFTCENVFSFSGESLRNDHTEKESWNNKESRKNDVINQKKQKEKKNERKKVNVIDI